jgi:hypothetical protein
MSPPPLNSTWRIMLDCILYITVKMFKLIEKNVLPVSFENKEKPDL